MLWLSDFPRAGIGLRGVRKSSASRTSIVLISRLLVPPLQYISAPENRSEFFGGSTDRLLFNYLDAHTFDRDLTTARFWDNALHPLYEWTGGPPPTAKDGRELESFLTRISEDGWRLVLLLDEIDVLLHHPILNSPEFFGSLRGLASRSQGSLAVVIAGRRSLSKQNEATQSFNPTGSPYFNIFDEITLGPLKAEKAAQVIGLAGDCFTSSDRAFITQIAGGHPFLLQLVASALWDAYEDDDQKPGEERWAEVGQSVADLAASTISDTWRLWTPETRQAFTAISLAHLGARSGDIPSDHKFKVDSLVSDLQNFRPELRLLKQRGFIVEDENVAGKWRVLPAAYLWWMVDEIVRTVREDTPFDQWLSDQEMGMLFTRGQKEQLGSAMKHVSQTVGLGIKELVKSTASGFVGGFGA